VLLVNGDKTRTVGMFSVFFGKVIV
jgi:hypothetical protein